MVCGYEDLDMGTWPGGVWGNSGGCSWGICKSLDLEVVSCMLEGLELADW